MIFNKLYRKFLKVKILNIYFDKFYIKYNNFYKSYKNYFTIISIKNLN